jgi:hypothetical protein
MASEKQLPLLPLSIGILAWKSGRTLIRTLESYKSNGLFNLTSDIYVLFQEASPEDYEIAKRFNIKGIFLPDNIGLGQGFARLAENARFEYMLMLEHDWKLIESADTTYARLDEGINLLKQGFDCVRYRHRKKFGYPHMAVQHFRKKDPDYFDDWILLPGPHVLEAVHWRKYPEKDWPDKIQKEKNYFITTSRYGCFTNNPCIYKKEFYIKNVTPYAGEGYSNEQNISFWWARQDFKIAQGEGLFQHDDRAKYGHPFSLAIKQWVNSVNPMLRNKW